MAKGSDFERTICKQLSLWWSSGKRDDIFWRTAGSGARATTRRKQGRATANSSGDIAALDMEGKPLVECITFELKRGYSRTSFADALDAPKRTKIQEWQGFIEQAYLSHRNEKSRYWALITRRNKREALICFPSPLLVDLRNDKCFETMPIPCGILWVDMSRSKEASVPRMLKVAVCKLEAFLHGVSPQAITKLVR